MAVFATGKQSSRRPARAGPIHFKFLTSNFYNLQFKETQIKEARKIIHWFRRPDRFPSAGIGQLFRFGIFPHPTTVGSPAQAPRRGEVGRIKSQISKIYPLQCPAGWAILYFVKMSAFPSAGPARERGAIF